MIRRGLPALAVAVLVCGVILSACGNDGLTLARSACTYVQRAVHLYNVAQHQPDAAQANNDRQRAEADLEDAIPLAADANSADPQWNPLMTTLQEVRRNNLDNLMPALEAQCHQASLPNEQPPPYNNVPQTTGGPQGSGPSGSGSTGGQPTPSEPTPSTIPNPKLP